MANNLYLYISLANNKSRLYRALMILSDWKSQERLTNEQIAVRLSEVLGKSIHQETVRLHVNGTIVPSSDVVQAYWQMTNGAVTPNDFYDLSSAENGGTALAEAGVG